MAVALFVAATVADDHSADFEKLDDRLDHLTARVHDLVAKIEARVDADRIKRARSLEQRVVTLEGDGCGKREFQCGSDDPQCIGTLLVCDGIKDCRNGHDEENCELPTTAGSYFEGHVVTDTCTKRRPDIISIEITSVRRDSYFSTVAYVRALVHITYESDLQAGEVALPTVGYYSFGSSKLVLAPPEDDRLGLVCEFDGYNADKCQGTIVHEASLETCATLVFTRRANHDDSDDHDHHKH
jgi:hypothetical protein